MLKQEELKANKGKKVDDPFTRRSTKPRMVYKPEDESEIVATIPVNDKSNSHPAGDSVSADKENGQDSKKKQSTEDLFNAHDFDITIDLEVPIPSKFCKNYRNLNFCLTINKQNKI